MAGFLASLAGHHRPDSNACIERWTAAMATALIFPGRMIEAEYMLFGEDRGGGRA
jgi:hypothetical protein